MKTAVINKRAGGIGLISGRKAFQRPMKEGVGLLNAIQDVYLAKDVTDRVDSTSGTASVFRTARYSRSASCVLLNASSSHGICSGSNSAPRAPRHRKRGSRRSRRGVQTMITGARPGYE